MQCDKTQQSIDLNGYSSVQSTAQSDTQSHFMPQTNSALLREESDLLSELDKVLDVNHCDENHTISSIATIDVKLTNENEDSSDTSATMSKFYGKFSEKCHEIEKLEKTVQNLHEQLKSSNHEKDANFRQLRDLQNGHNCKVGELERRILDLDNQLKLTKEKNAFQEETTRKANLDREAQLQKQMEAFKKTAEIASKERDSAVIKYAQRENEILKLESTEKKQIQQIAQLNTEKEALNARLRGAKNEKEQILHVLQQKENEISDLKRKHDDSKKFTMEQEVKIKVTEKRVQLTEEAHNETRNEMDKLGKKLKDSKEENLTLKANYEEMIKQLQTNIPIEALDHEEPVLDIHNIRTFDNALREIESLRQKLIEESEQFKIEISNLQTDCKEKCQKIRTCEEACELKQTEIERLEIRIKNFEEEMLNSDRLKYDFSEQSLQISRLKSEISDLEAESESFQANAERMLSLTQQLTDQNMILKSENDGFKSKLIVLEKDQKRFMIEFDETKAAHNSLKAETDVSIVRLKNETSLLNDQLASSLAQVKELTTSLDDEKNQNRVLRKKHVAAVKELKSELSLLKRRLEAYEEAGTASQCSGSSTNGNEDHLLPSCTSRSHSRSPSMTSLDMTSGGLASGSQSKGATSPVSGTMPQISCDHNQKMIEKIVKLQRMLARRTEKIEFLEEHVKQMTKELQRKSRIIQLYVLREETGSLAPLSADLNKVAQQRSNHHNQPSHYSAMGRIFGGNNNFSNVNNFTTPAKLSDMSDLSPELSVQIMIKLQALFEDTLLKNITLKENIQTLGEEISNLSRENRSLKLDREKDRL